MAGQGGVWGHGLALCNAAGTDQAGGFQDRVRDKAANIRADFHAALCMF